MEKPKQQIDKFYDYMKCRDYIEKKYGYKTRNFANCKYTGKPDDAPYQDFWHYLCDRMGVQNGCTFELDINDIDNAEEGWQKKIILDFLNEFGTGKNQAVTFHVEW
jgi:hypothetical protein